jgi:hypothetical protein
VAGETVTNNLEKEVSNFDEEIWMNELEEFRIMQQITIINQAELTAKEQSFLQIFPI